MKASAGSGKTFSLAREYIRLLLKNRKEDHPYRHILAVTFTNKATAEMKTRIIESLDTLARFPEYSFYRDYLKRECDIESDEELSRECSRMLTDILCDYGAFSVSTIDHFFQGKIHAAQGNGFTDLCDFSPLKPVNVITVPVLPEKLSNL